MGKKSKAAKKPSKGAPKRSAQKVKLAVQGQRAPNSSPAIVSKKSTTSPAALVAAMDKPVGFMNQGAKKSLPYAGRDPISKAVSQFLNPLGGALQRLPPGASGQMSMTTTSLASTHQVFRYTVPYNYNALTTFPTLPYDFSTSGATTNAPLFDLTQGVPLIHFWDPETTLMYPSFSESAFATTYTCTQFANYLSNKIPMEYDPSPTSQYLLADTVPVPQVFPCTSVNKRCGPYKPLTKINGVVCFWSDSGSNLTVRVTPVTPGSGFSGFLRVSVFYYGPSGEPYEMDYDAIAYTSSGAQLTTIFLLKASGWYSLKLSGNFGVTAPSSLAGYVTLDEVSTTNSNQVQTGFVTNPAYHDNINLITGDRVLGSSAQIYCSSPVLEVSGRFLGAIGHNYSDDFRQAVSNVSVSVNSSPNNGFYDGPLLSMGDADGGIYSVLTPKRGFVMEDVDSTNANPVKQDNFSVSNLFPNGEDNFGYNIIVIRPTFGGQQTSVEFEIVLAQSVEYVTGSQFLYSEKTLMTQIEMMQFLDIVRSVDPFCPNPFHMQMVRDFLSKAAHAAREGVGFAARALPMASKIAYLLGRPAIGATLAGAGYTANRISNLVGQ